MEKICFIVASPGTADSFLLNHFLCLLKKYEVHLVANFSQSHMTNFQGIGVVCHNIQIERKVSISNDIKALIGLCKLFQSERFDSVHSVTPKAGLLTAIAGWIVKVPRRIHIFTGQVWATRRGISRLSLKLLDCLIAKLNTNLLVDGNSQRRFLISEGVLTEDNSFVLANGSITGVQLEKYIISPNTRASECAKFKISSENIVYLYLGRLCKDKGIGELLSSFNRFVLDCPDSVLIFYGSDEEGYDEKIKDYPNIIRGGNFFYPGRTSQPYLSMQVADVFVLPTWREGFGMSVIEAQALGIPVITSDAYGVLDASVEGVTGLRYRVKDVDGLYKCMKRYYEDAALRKKHGLSGRRRVEEKFSSAIVCKAWQDYYDSLFSKN